MAAMIFKGPPRSSSPAKGSPVEPSPSWPPLLHEAAHGLAHVRKIPDTSRQGRYHNRRYQVLAEELSLDVAEAGAFGWSSTTIRDVTIKEYRRELRRFQGALTLYRRAELTADGGRRSPRTCSPARAPAPVASGSPGPPSRRAPSSAGSATRTSLSYPHEDEDRPPL